MPIEIGLPLALELGRGLPSDHIRDEEGGDKGLIHLGIRFFLADCEDNHSEFLSLCSPFGGVLLRVESVRKVGEVRVDAVLVGEAHGARTLLFGGSGWWRGWCFLGRSLLGRSLWSGLLAGKGLCWG